MPESANHAVFLSYAREDTAAARRIADALHGFGVEVWFDRSELRGGDAWDTTIRRQIKDCALFLPVISVSTNARPEGYFRLEWRLADQRTHLMGRSKAFLVPVCIDDTDDADADVPDSFLAVQWTRVASDNELASLASRVRTLLDGTMTPRASVTRMTGAVSLGKTAPADKSIAVLAFANLSGNPENEYFSDGISEELLNVLAKIPGLRVTARTSSFFFKGKNVPVPEIAQKLGVAYVLEGSVRRAGSRVRITAQLIDGAEGFHLWSENFDRELTDIFTLQDEIARDIAAKLQITVGATGRGAANPEVHRLVLQGRHLWNEFSEDAFRQAVEVFNKAIELEPGCATALAGIANVHCRRAIMSGLASHHLESVLAQAETHARRALQADATLAEPHAVLGCVAHGRGRLAEAEHEFQRALTLNPNSDLALVYHARLLLRQGRCDLAVQQTEKAQQLSPLVGGFAGHRATALLAGRRYAEAEGVVARAENLLAGSIWTKALWALALARLGRREAALAKARVVLAPGADEPWVAGMSSMIKGIAAWALVEAGAQHEAEDVAQQILQQPAHHRYGAGFVLAKLGCWNDACTVWEDMPQWTVDNLFILGDHDETIGNDPRFLELLRKLGAREGFDTLRQVLAKRPT